MEPTNLRDQRRFGELLAELAAAFGRVPLSRLDAEIDRGLDRLIEWFEVDRSSLTEVGLDDEALLVTHSRVRPGFEPFTRDDVRPRVPFSARIVLAGRTISFERPEALSPEHADLRRFAESEGMLSHVTTPISVGEQVVGGLHVATLSRHRSWSEADLRQLETLAHVFAGAVERRRFSRLARESRELTEAVLRSIEDLVAVVDGEGHVVSANEAWRDSTGIEAAEPGAYRSLCEAVDRPGAPNRPELIAGIEAVVAGETDRFEREYRISADGAEAWYRLVAAPLRGELAGAVITHTDVTRLRRALAEVERLGDRLAQENLALREEIQAGHDFNEIVGNSAALRESLSLVSRVAPTASTVLLLGETGTGKELLARAIHARSPRADRILATLNCPALSQSLIESELFGHERGAFTGAERRKLGRFEVADGGTVFLDEIGELSLDVQAKLLRVLQEGEFQRVGDTRTRRVDVRLIVATNRDLRAAVREGIFREDLYYRLAVFPITLPSLRQRREDIPLLVWHFVDKYARQVGRPIERISTETMESLQRYDWPGNVRELENVVERAVVLSHGGELGINPGELESRSVIDVAVGDRLDDVMRAHILRTVERCGGRINGTGNAAERLGIHPNTLRSRMKKLGIQRPAR